jgi:hypothetical protein
MKITWQRFIVATLQICVGCCHPDETELFAPVAGIGFVAPSLIFLDRTCILQISGVNTHFNKQTLVDFNDEKIKAQILSVNDFNMKLLVTADSSAQIGQHNIRISTGEEVLVQSGVLDVEAPLRLAESVAETELIQGGLADISVVNLDYINNPFNPGSVSVASGPRLLKLNGVSSSKFSWLGLIDVDSMDRSLNAKLKSTNPLGQAVSYDLLPAPPPLAKKAPIVALSVGEVRKMQSFPTSYSTNVYRVDGVVQNSVLHLAFSNVGLDLHDAGISVGVASTNGRFTEGQLITNPSGVGNLLNSLIWVSDPGTTYFSVFAGDYSGKASGYEYDISLSSKLAEFVNLAELSSADSPANPLANVALGGAFVGINGKIDIPGDNDFIRYVAKESGKVIAQALGSPALSVRVAHFEGDCTTPRTGLPARAFQQETDVIGGNSYCVRLSGSVITPYRLILSLSSP